jgi:hypothetical protein
VAQARAAEERPRAARGGEELVAERIIGRARGEPAGVGHRDVHREVRHAVRVVGRAVERVHEEAQVPRAGPGRAGLLGEDRGAGEAAPQEPEHRGLARPIRVGDEVDPALQLDRALRPPPLPQDRAAAARRLDAHIPQLRHLRHRHLQRPPAPAVRPTTA